MTINLGKGRGGKRIGSGRKALSTKKTVTIKLEKEIIDLMHSKIPSGKRSQFIGHCIGSKLLDPDWCAKQIWK